MINHARSLLLNLTAKAVANADVDSAYIPNDFTPQAIPKWLLPVSRAIFPDGATISQRVCATDALCDLLQRVELAPYVLSLDSRITYGNNAGNQGLTLTSLIAAVADAREMNELHLSTIATRLMSPSVASSAPGLFVWTERADRAVQLAELRMMWSAGASMDKLLSIGGIVLGYVYQLERLRTGGA